MRRNQFKFTLLLMVVVIPLALAQIKLPPSAAKKVDYKQDIQPILFAELLLLPWSRSSAGRSTA